MLSARTDECAVFPVADDFVDSIYSAADGDVDPLLIPIGLTTLPIK